jgi:hypothetical protein
MDDQSKLTRWGKFSDAAEAKLPEYRALSGLAVVGFLLGLFSVLAIVHISLSFVGAAAALCCLAALIRISASPSEISGRRLALAGFVLAVFWTTSGLAKELTRQRLLDAHSRAFAVHWFEYLKKGEPEKAFELRNAASARRPLDSKLLGHYLSSRMDYEGLEEFVAKPAVRALLTLGDRAQVSHYTFDGADAEKVGQVFAVTYDDHGTKKSFLVHMTLVRSHFPDYGTSAWQIDGSHAPWTPDAHS